MKMIASITPERRLWDRQRQAELADRAISQLSVEPYPVSIRPRGDLENSRPAPTTAGIAASIARQAQGRLSALPSAQVRSNL